jgi:hypothetical protein
MEGLSCDDWVETEMSDRFFYTCQNLEDNYGCDCSGCKCQSTSTTTTPDDDCATTTSCLEMDCQTVSEMSGLSYYALEEHYGCDCAGCPGCDPEGCDGYSCEDWQAVFSGNDNFVICDALESQLGCDCSGCDCATTTTTTTTTITCQTTCDQLDNYFNTGNSLTCDDVRALEDTMSCAYLETFFGCDCSGCLCEQVPDLVCA